MDEKSGSYVTNGQISLSILRGRAEGMSKEIVKLCHNGRFSLGKNQNHTNTVSRLLEIRIGGETGRRARCHRKKKPGKTLQSLTATR